MVATKKVWRMEIQFFSTFLDFGQFVQKVYVTIVWQSIDDNKKPINYQSILKKNNMCQCSIIIQYP